MPAFDSIADDLAQSLDDLVDRDRFETPSQQMLLETLDEAVIQLFERNVRFSLGFLFCSIFRKINFQMTVYLAELLNSGRSVLPACEKLHFSQFYVVNLAEGVSSSEPE